VSPGTASHDHSSNFTCKELKETMPDQARTKKRKEKGKEKTRSEDDVLMDKAEIEEERKSKNEKDGGMEGPNIESPISRNALKSTKHKHARMRDL